jgi:hypothetical protein|tara:strand:+ start:335 stop:1303 length:969 start_codon:yes stop_codon:yes gene_type:complete
MRKIQDVDVVQIDVTNACHLSCANCTRFVGHHEKNYFLSLDEIEKALQSLNGFKGNVGLMGGEPCLHPQFKDICDLWVKYIPEKERREIWTAGLKWDKYKDIINDVFLEKNITYNDHSDPDEGEHQPLLIAIDEIVQDIDLMDKLIDNCWVQLRWSPVITNRGAFFCEVAGSMDNMFNGPGGWKVEKDWWRRKPSDYTDQINEYCKKCSGCLPMPIPNNHVAYDYVSPGNYNRLKKHNSPKLKQGRVQVVDVKEVRKHLIGVDGNITNGLPDEEGRGGLKSHPQWHPWVYRGEKDWHAPGEGYLTGKQVRNIQVSLDTTVQE